MVEWQRCVPHCICICIAVHSYGTISFHALPPSVARQLPAPELCSSYLPLPPGILSMSAGLLL